MLGMNCQEIWSFYEHRCMYSYGMMIKIHVESTVCWDFNWTCSLTLITQLQKVYDCVRFLYSVVGLNTALGAQVRIELIVMWSHSFVSYVCVLSTCLSFMVHMWLCLLVHVEVRGRCWLLLSFTYNLYMETGSLIEPETHQFSYGGWPVNHEQPQLTVLGITKACCYKWLLCES